MANPEATTALPERVWAIKPWWCQPWSILATGLTLDAGSWWLIRAVWLTGLVVVAVSAWWWLFLVLMPAQWRNMVRDLAEEAEAAVEASNPAGTAVRGSGMSPNSSRSTKGAATEPEQNQNTKT